MGGGEVQGFGGLKKSIDANRAVKSTTLVLSESKSV